MAEMKVTQFMEAKNKVKKQTLEDIIFSCLEEESKIKRRKRHPRVKINIKNLIMTVKVHYPYEIDLERCTSSSQVLDFLFQINNKRWGKRDVFDTKIGSELLHAFEDACQLCFNDSAQGVFCPCGKNMIVNWRERTKQPA